MKEAMDMAFSGNSGFLVDRIKPTFSVQSERDIYGGWDLLKFQRRHMRYLHLCLRKFHGLAT